MKKKYILMGVAGMFVASTVIGGTLAALNTDTEGGVGAAVAGISLENIGISIADDSKLTQELEIADFAPGGEWRNPYHSVYNSTKEGYSLYAKVVVDRYWTNPSTGETEGEYVDLSDNEIASAFVIDSSNEKAEFIDVGDAAGQYILNDWIVTYADAEQMVMYYRKPIASGEMSSDFLSGISFSSGMGNDYADKECHMAVTVTAVQTNNSADAIAAELGVFPSFDEEGNITWISETRPDNYGE